MSLNRLGRNLSENEVQNSILEYLRYAKITAWRNNNGATYDPTNKIHRKKNKWETIYGSPVDILGCLPDGRFLAIEVKKDEKGRPSKGQRDFIRHINESGGLAFVAFSIDCVKQALKQYQ